MPPRNKKQNASASEKRNDSGLIAPGKRIPKDKDKHQQSSASASAYSASAANATQRLNFHSATSQSKSASLTPSPSDDATAATTAAAAAASADEPTSADVAEDMGKSSRLPGRGLQTSFDDSVDTADPQSAVAAATALTEPDQSHVVANGHSTKPSTLLGAACSSLQSVTTVIRPHSSWDVFAILLLLLQLPSLPIVIIQILFVFLTLGNNQSIWSLFSLLSSPDWLRGHAGNPSIVATLMIDTGFLCIWLFLPLLIQELVLDFAPAVVALSLGGGAAAKHSWKHGLLCLVTVSICRLVQGRQRLHYLLDFLAAVLSRFGMTNISSFLTSWAILPTSQPPSRTWARIGLELHIVTHGCIRVIRRWLDRSVHSSNKTAAASSKGDNDSVSLAAANSTLHHHHSPEDTNPDSSRNAAGTDGRPPGQPPAAAKDKSLPSGKKRRKQATLVRSQQPFWAAIATTKIQVSKEFEQSHAERDNFEASATNIRNLGDAASKALDDRVWITSVDETEVDFVARLHHAPPPQQKSLPADSSPSTSSSNSRRGSQARLPVDVRINGAFWASVDVQQTDAENQATSATQQASLETHCKIFDLAPASTYFIEFLQPGEEKLIFATVLLTPSDDNSTQATATTVAPQDPMRPSSPVTTLRQSIEAANTKLNEQKTRNNKSRKGRQGSGRALKQEINDLSRNLSSVSTNERQQQKQIQIRQNIKQAEDQTAELASQLANLGDIPESDQEAFENSQASWTQVDRQRQTLKKAVESSKRDGQRKVTEAYQENSKIRSKKEKAEGRLTTLTERRKATAEENNTKRNAKGMSETQHSYKMDKFRAVEGNLMRDVSMWENQRRETEAQTGQIVAQLDMFSDGGFAPIGTKGHLPNAPEAHYSSRSGGVLPMNPFGVGPFASSSSSSMSQQQQQQQQQQPRFRGRSSSMLSDISGFTDEETNPAQYGMEASQYPAALAGRDIVRNGSGSPRTGNGQTGSGSSSSQRPSPIGSEAPPRGSPRLMKR